MANISAMLFKLFSITLDITTRNSRPCLKMPLTRHNLFTRILFSGFVLCVWTMLAAAAFADITLPQLFSDHMVLQRNSKIKVWGTAEPAQKLVIKFDKQEVKATANAKGEWFTFITTAAAGGPYELEIAAEAGEPKVVFSDVMVGEVWLCSGHNMEWPVSKALNSETEIELSRNFPSIRLFSVGNHASVLPLDNFTKVEPWRVCAPESVKDFSATAYFFGRELSKGIKDIPIGLIDSSMEFSVCEAWCSRKSLDKVESLAPLLKHWDESEKPPTDENRPSILFNGMIAPLKSFPIRGVIWYQGEANHGRGHQYATLLPTLITDWRNTFSDPKMPFYLVQLAPHRYEGESPEGLPELWDAQLKTTKADPNTELVVTTDIGDLKELHPKNKQEVGRRLSLVALSNLYKNEMGEAAGEIVASGPIYESKSTNENRIRIVFKEAKGLKLINEDKSLTNFQICGEDGVFVQAEAKIDGEAVEVRSDKVKNPVHVRYCWSDSIEPNLVNGEGLPASPFRTDDFPLDSADRDF